MTKTALALALLDISHDAFLSAIADDRTHIVVRIVGRAYLQSCDLLLELLHKLLVDRLVNDGTRTGGTLLSLISERRHHHTVNSGIDIHLAVDDNCVLASHLRHDAFDPDLPLLGLCRELIDSQPDVARTSKRDEPRLLG